MASLYIFLKKNITDISQLLTNNKGGESGVAVTRSHGKDQDVGSNPATDRNEKTHIGQTSAQKVPQ